MWTPFKDDYAYGWNIGEPRPGPVRRPQAHRAQRRHQRLLERDHPPARSELTFIVLSNNDTANASAIGRDLAAIYFGHPYTIPEARTVASRRSGRSSIAMSASTSSRPGFVITVTREGNSLMTQATGQGKFEVFPESETKFFAKVAPIGIAFVQGADGTISHAIVTQGGRDQQAKKIE